MFEVKISSKEGFNVGVLNNLFIILNTTLTIDLINEYYSSIEYAKRIEEKLKEIKE